MARIYTRKEVEARKLKFRIFAGMFDFLGTVGSMLLIFACVILLVALYTWIAGDAQTSFKTIYDSFEQAIIVPETTVLPY